ncbi:MAG: bifunctional DNA primase/polymerase, partial [Anaerolineae bacterium]|nr:bifunctional DNA primase/polymerase [Anaerolineae bacterium]
MSTKTTSPNPITIPLAPSSRPRGCSLAEKPETHNHSSPSAGTHLTPMTNDLLTHALHYAASGFSVIPIKRGAKSPAVPWTRWQTECPDPEQLTRWFNNGHHEALGLVTGAVSNGLTILDFDGDGWQQAFEQFLTEFPDLRDTRWIKSGSGKRHLWIAAADLTNGDGQPITRLQFARPDLGEKTAIEVRANTVQTLAPPSRHPSGGRYEFLNEAPILRLDDLHLIITWLAQWAQPPLTTDERYRVSWTADDLLSATLPAPRYIVPDILPEGLNIL